MLDNMIVIEKKIWSKMRDVDMIFFKMRCLKTITQLYNYKINLLKKLL